MKIKANRKRGYFGIGIYNPKTTENMGTLWRSAFLWGADFIFTIGLRYSKQPTDTTDASKHIPLYNYETFKDFKKAFPMGASLVCVEQDKKAKSLKNYVHPESGVYLLGAEDYGIPKNLLKGNQIIEIPCMESFSGNVAVAGSIVMYDRFVKSLTMPSTDSTNPTS